LKIIWQGWYVDYDLDIPPEKEIARCKVWRPRRPSVEGQVSDDSTSNPAVWQIFIQVMADFAMKMRRAGYVGLYEKEIRNTYIHNFSRKTVRNYNSWKTWA
jgi:hypothetical protein